MSNADKTENIDGMSNTDHPETTPAKAAEPAIGAAPRIEKASEGDIQKILQFYSDIIDAVNRTDIRLGWRIDRYPDESFAREMTRRGEMFVIKEGADVIAAAAVNHDVNPEYHDIDWRVKGPDEKIATIHALAVSPKRRGSGLSGAFLRGLEEQCRRQRDIAIHLDVIDTNIPAYKLYLRNGYEERDCIEMYYEVVGTRTFWMMEKIL